MIRKTATATLAVLATFAVVVAGTLPATTSAQVSAAFSDLIRPANGETLPLDAWSMRAAINGAEVSPDGRLLAIGRAQNIDGNYIVEVRQVNNLQAEPVRLGSRHAEIFNFEWINNEKLFVEFVQEVDDGNDTYFAYNSAIIDATDPDAKWDELEARTSGGARSLSSRVAAQYRVLLRDRLVNDPDNILVLYYDNDDPFRDVGRYNLNTGRISLVIRGNNTVSGGFTPDWEGEIRAATGADGGFTEFRTFVRAKGSDEWQLLHTALPEERENFSVVWFSKENPDEVYVMANRGKDTAGIYLMDINTGEYTSDCLFCPQGVDATGVIFDGKPDSFGDVLGFFYTGAQPERYYIDEEERALYEGVQDLFPGKYAVMSSRSDDDSAIVVRTSADDDPGTYYLLKGKRELQYLASASTIEEEQLSPTKYVKFTARDGLEIPAYVTVPAGNPPFPAVVMPHGGPWVRDTIVYDRWAQMLAHYGYVVIQPNYRGSTGYGLKHWMAGDAKWGLEMQDDVDDAALYLVEQGLADRDRLAIYGFSYGGYSALVGAMRENNIYQCSIAAATVGNLDGWRARIGRNRYSRVFQLPTVQGINPIDHVEDVNIPLLMLHGSIDSIADVKHGRDFTRAIEGLGKDYKYVEIEGMDHGDTYYDHRDQFWTEVLDWLDTKCG